MQQQQQLKQLKNHLTQILYIYIYLSKRKQQLEQQQQEERFDRFYQLEESQTSVIDEQQTTAPPSGRVSPSASSTSYATCTPYISCSIQNDSSSTTLAKIIDIQRTAKRQYDVESSNTSNIIEQPQQEKEHR